MTSAFFAGRYVRLAGCEGRWNTRGGGHASTPSRIMSQNG